MDACYDAETYLCPDLLGFQEKVVFVNESSLVRNCKDFEAEACAVINFKMKTCTIYLNGVRGPTASDLTHERNHCRGWNHEDINTGEYEKEHWFPIRR